MRAHSRYLVLYKLNSAHWPADPKVALEAAETNFAADYEMVKAGIVKDQGSFNPGDGFMIVELLSLEEAYKLSHSFYPHMTVEIREIVSCLLYTSDAADTPYV